MTQEHKIKFINAQWIYYIKRKQVLIKKHKCHVCDNDLKEEYVEIKLYNKHLRQNITIDLCLTHGRMVRI